MPLFFPILIGKWDFIESKFSIVNFWKINESLLLVIWASLSPQANTFPFSVRATVT